MTPESVGLVRDCDAGLVLGKHSGRCAVWGCTPQHQDWAGSAQQAARVLGHEMPTGDTSLASCFHPRPCSKALGTKLAQMGFVLPQEQLNEVFKRFKSIAERKKVGCWMGGQVHGARPMPG